MPKKKNTTKNNLSASKEPSGSTSPAPAAQVQPKNDPVNLQQSGKVSREMVADDAKAGPRKAMLEADSLWGIIQTCFFYVMTDLRKKQRQFAIGVTTIFLTVSVVTFLDALINVAPSVTLISSQSTVGDFDILL